MFRLPNKNDLKDALDAVQDHLRKTDLGLELTQKEIRTIEQLGLFQDIGNRYKSKGLTNWGGLAWFCSQVIGTIINKIDECRVQSDVVFELADRLTLVALFIGNSSHELQLNKEDMGPIQTASQYAVQWVNYTSTQDDILFHTEDNFLFSTEDDSLFPAEDDSLFPTEDDSLFPYNVVPWRKAIR